jgi:hypothetical protein
MKGRPIGIALTLAVITACGGPPRLQPSPGAQLAPGDPDAAVASAAGIDLTAWPDRWRGHPTNLALEVTPILVRIENNSTEPLELRFTHFNLDNPANVDFSPIPPFNIEETVSVPVRPADFALSGFRVAPYLRGYYPSLGYYGHPFFFDRVYYDRMSTAWVPVELPTADMVSMALPEGILDPGGVATGFVYFEDVSDDPAEVALEFDLVTPRTGMANGMPEGSPNGELGGRMRGTIRIPFMVR